jgi:NADH-quinone oxidoreductase subunit J
VTAVSVAAVLFAALVMAIRSAGFVPDWMDTTQRYPVGALGQALLGDYLVPFELASVLLLVVMIGAAYLAKARRREETRRARGSATLSRKARQWS